MPESEGTTRLRIAREQAKTELTKEQLATLRAVLHDGKEVIVEIIRTATTNPLMGAVLGFVLADILNRLKVIDNSTALLIDGIITAAYAVDMSADLINGITNITHVSGSTPSADIVKPSAQVVVFGNQGASPPLSADLIARLSGVGAGG